MWLYQLQRANGTVADERDQYPTERDARIAGERAKQWIEEAHYPYEELTVITKSEGSLR